jgi:hypothetical protein
MATAYPGGLRKRGGLLDYEDTIQATPRNPFFGGVADLLGQAYKLPEMPRMGVPGLDFMAANRNRLMDLLGVGDVQKTAEALSYGNRLGTGRGMTYQPLPETMGAAMAVAPMVAPAARMAGEGAMAVGRAGERLAERVVPQVMERGGLLSEMVGAMGNRTISPLDVYHGSPHTFPPTPKNPLGEFDASKIGTGEGAQAFGHGIYTAESPNVAKGYAEQLSTAKGPLGDVAKYWRKNGGESAFRSFAKDAGLPPAEIENTANVIRNTGNLYKVDLPDAKIAQMLDWDKPLSQQSKQVKQAIEKTKAMLPSNALDDLGGDLSLMYGPNVMPVEFLNTWESLGQKAGGEIALQKFGIPGIKYFDEGSRNLANTYIVRNPQGGENVFSSKAAAEAYVKKYPEETLIEPKVTRNFVVFPGEEKSMTILERNAKKAEELKRLQAGGLLAP